MKKYGIMNRPNGQNLMNFWDQKRQKSSKLGPGSSETSCEEVVLTAVSSCAEKLQ